MRYKKKYTQKEWNKFPDHVAELLCKRYNVILTDHKTKRQKQIEFLKKFNMKNVDKGIDMFNQGVQEFGKMMDDMTKELGGNNKQKVKLWSDKKQSSPDLKIWPEKQKLKRKRKKKKVVSRDQENLRRIWGK